MKRLFLVCAIASLLVAVGSMVWAAVNLNSSKSNVYRIVYPDGAVTSTQATAILQEIDKSGQVGEAQVRQILQRNGVRADSIKKIFWQPPGKTSKLPTLFLLTDPTQEPAAREIAVSDSGVVTPKPVPIPIKK